MMMLSNLVIVLVFGLLFIVGGTWLQIYLSKKENKWLGLMLPAFTFLLALLVTFLLASPTALTTASLYVDGVLVESTQEIAASSWGQVFTIFIFMNVPTGILMLIYVATRANLKKRNDLEKMAIQDLS